MAEEKASGTISQRTVMGVQLDGLVSAPREKMLASGAASRSHGACCSIRGRHQPRYVGYACHATVHPSCATCCPGAHTWVRAAPCTASTPSVPLKVEDASNTMTAIRVAWPCRSRLQPASRHRWPTSGVRLETVGSAIACSPWSS